MPSVSTADRNAGPVPGRGPMSVIASSTATSVGSASISAIVIQVRRLRISLSSSTRDHVRSSRSEPASVAASTTSSSVRRSGDSSTTRTPPSTSRALRTAGSPTRTSRLSRRGARPGRRAGRAPVPHRGCGRTVRPVGCCSVVEVVLDHQPTAVEHADAGAQLLDLGEQVAGQEDRRALAVQRQQQLTDLADALRVEPVGRLVEDQQRGRRSKAPASPSRCRMPSEYARTGRPSTPASPTWSSASSMRRDRDRRSPPGPIASKMLRFARPDRCAYAAGPSTSAPTDGSTDRAAPASACPSARPRRWWRAPGRAASAPWWSCRSRWRRGSRRCRPRGRRGRAGPPPGSGRTAS